MEQQLIGVQAQRPPVTLSCPSSFRDLSSGQSLFVTWMQKGISGLGGVKWNWDLKKIMEYRLKHEAREKALRGHT